MKVSGDPGRVHAEGLSVLRDGKTICHDISLDVAYHGCLGIVGPNGSGKSTLLLGLRGLLPVRGRVALGGIDPTRARRNEVARVVAVMPQRMEFSVPYTVEEMVLLGRAPHRRPWERYPAEDRERVAALLERFGLGSDAHTPVNELSGGERRKTYLARALAQDTPLLFLDEPTAGLDPAALSDLVSVIGGLRSEGKTIVTVLHDVRLAAVLCDQVLGLREGRAVMSGSPGEVLDPDSLRDLFGIPWDDLRDGTGAAVLLPRLMNLDEEEASP